MNDVTDLKIRRALAEVLDATPVVPPFDEVMQRTPPHRMITPPVPRRTGIYAGLAAAALLVAVVAWPRSDDDAAVTTETIETPTSAEPVAPDTTSVSPSVTPAPTSSSLPPATTSTVPVEPARIFADFDEPDLGPIALEGGPLEFAELPDGWSLSYSGEDSPGDTVTVPMETPWIAFVTRRQSASDFTNALTISVERLLPGQQVRDGSFASSATVAGRVGWITEPTIGRYGNVIEPMRFTSELPDRQRLVVEGAEDVDELEALLADIVQIEGDDGSTRFDLSRLDPDRFTTSEQIDRSEPTEHLWRTGYWTPNGGMFAVTVRLNPAHWLDDAHPDPLSAVLAGTWSGLGSDTYLVLRPSPSVSIELSGAGLDPGTLEQRVELAEALVPVERDEWARRLVATELVETPPDRPIACTNPQPEVLAVRVNGLEQSLDDPTDQWTAEPGDQVEIDLMVPDGVEIDAAVLVASRSSVSENLAPSRRLRGSTTIRFTWDGTMGGVAVQPWRYQVSLSGTVTGVEVDCPDPLSDVQPGWGVFLGLRGGYAVYE